jgi:tetratricopeptide (TPR) repeat protein
MFFYHPYKGVHRSLDFYRFLGYILSMFRFLRRLFSFQQFTLFRKPQRDTFVEEKWTADFGNVHKTRFDIKSESAFTAKLRERALSLSLKRTGCFAWLSAPGYLYGDAVINARMILDARGGYGAGGLLFRKVDEDTYYSFMISSKGYFRLDVVRNRMPLALAGWTELPSPGPGRPASPHKGGAGKNGGGPDGEAISFTIILYGSHIIILINGAWAAEIGDATIPGGGELGLAAASYEGQGERNAEVLLEYLSVDTRLSRVIAAWEQWTDPASHPPIDPVSRFRLAETFTAMNQPGAALTQLRKAWEDPGCPRTRKELLLAGRLAQRLGLEDDAEAYIEECIASGKGAPEGRAALTEKGKILYAGGRFGDLKEFCLEAVREHAEDPVLWTLLGHAYWNDGESENAAGAYDRAFEMDRENGIPAKNAANLYEILGRKEEALDRLLRAGRAFLGADNFDDLGLLIPRLLSLGAENREAHSLAGKWAFGIEDWTMATAELAKAETMEGAPGVRDDAAAAFLLGLLLIRQGKRREAIPLLEKAAAREPEYALYHFRLAENLFLLEENPDDPRMRAELEKALSLSAADLEGGEGPDRINAGWIHNFAAQVGLHKGDLEGAAAHLDKAAQVLGDVPAIRVNRGVLAYLRGSLSGALELLSAEKAEDPEGIMANCGGNLLVRAGRYDEADDWYRKALLIQPQNVEYLCNRAACLVELGRYGEADGILARTHGMAPSPMVLELICFVASKKGELARAEAAGRSALEMDPRHVPSLFSLGWVLLTLGKNEEARDLLTRLDGLALAGESARRREEYRNRIDEVFYRKIPCARCGREWRVLKDPPPTRPIRLYAMPPEELPAGSCPECGKTFCIRCAKDRLDETGRFICPECGKPLKLINGGLKKLIADWAAVLPGAEGGTAKRKRGRPRKNTGGF